MILMKQDSMEEIRKSSNEDQNCVHKNVHEKMESRQHQTDILPNLECDDKLQKVSKSKIDQQEESGRNEGHRKVKVEECSHHIEAAQESIQNCEADENEQNGKRMIIKVEKFEYSDDILPPIAVEHNEPEQSSENKTNMLVNLEDCCDKLEIVSEGRIYQMEENKRNSGIKKIKEYEFYHDIEAAQESIQNFEADENEQNGKRMIIKVEKFEYNDDILPPIAVEHYEPEQSSENQTNVLVKSEHYYDKLTQTSQVSFNQPEEYEVNKDCTTIVVSAVYEISGECNSSRKPYSKLRRRGENCSEKPNHKILNVINEFEGKDTVSSEFTQDDDSKSLNIKASKPNTDRTDSQCYVALEKLSYKCDICRYVTVMKEMLVSHMKLHNFKQSGSISKCELRLKNQIILEEYEHKKKSLKQFSCNLCSYKGTQISHLIRHKVTHTGEKPFACNLCSYKSARKDNLNSHKLLHTGEKPFACNLCSYRSAHKSCLNIHKVTHTGEKPFACNLCSYRSAHKSCLNIHKVTHTGEKPFGCNLCSYKSVSKSGLNIHKLQHTGEKPFACNICSYTNAQKSNLLIHQLTHTGKKPFACNLCSYKSVQKSDLNRHMLKHTGEKPFACNLCSHKCALKSSLKIHKLTHTGEKPFSCNLCSYKSARKIHLNIHKLKHTGEMPFACNMCSYKSAQKSNLLKHQLKHTGEKPFGCKLCSYKSVSKSRLNEHVLSHTGEKPFACNLCSYKCVRKSSLQRHQLSHAGEKPFACNLCSHKCALKSSLKIHKLTHTGEKPFQSQSIYFAI